MLSNEGMGGCLPRLSFGRRGEVGRTRLQVVDVGELERGDGDPDGEFGGVNGARGFRVLSEFFGDGFDELGAKMPEQ